MTSTARLDILVGTRNPGKIREIRDGLCSLPVRLRYLNEFSNVSPVDEVGRTYEENAALKALVYSKQTGVCALADDSGLEVEALGGGPGVFSARFGGDHASDQERIEKLLTALSQCRGQERRARFVCCMALTGWTMEEEQTRVADPRLLHVTEGKCEGFIATRLSGTNGFGFDPVFVPKGYRETFAELPAEVKASISHRALALAAMREFLGLWLGQT